MIDKTRSITNSTSIIIIEQEESRMSTFESDFFFLINNEDIFSFVWKQWKRRTTNRRWWSNSVSFDDWLCFLCDWVVFCFDSLLLVCLFSNVYQRLYTVLWYQLVDHHVEISSKQHISRRLSSDQSHHICDRDYQRQSKSMTNIEEKGIYSLICLLRSLSSRSAFSNNGSAFFFTFSSFRIS